MTGLALAADSRLDTLPGVSLDELNDRAALQTRVDRKYLLSPAEASDFVARLPEGTAILEIDGRRRFGYASTYYDTDGLESFLATAHRRPRRAKVRTRTYLDTGSRWLEVKTKQGPHTVKHRVPHSGRPDLDFVAAELDAGRVPMTGELRPTLGVSYRRSTLLLPDAEARVTIDGQLTWLLNGQGRSAPGVVVVETKGGTRPSSADRYLRRAGHRPAGFSKYATGLALLRPELPSNRWHRLLTSPLLAA